MNMRLPGLTLVVAIAIITIVAAWVIRGRHDSGAAAAAAAVSSPSDPASPVGILPTSARISSLKDHGKKSQRLQENSSYLRELMRQYALEKELDKRGALLAILQSMPNAEVKRFALQLAASSDPVTRREGLELLKAFSLGDAQVRDFLVGQIDQEHDPAMLKELVDMLTPTMVATEDAAPLVEQLVRLREHSDPEVRAASVLQSSQWDKGSDLENTLHQAMMDPDVRVRQAAIGGITSERVHTDRLKDMLLAIANDPQTSERERSAALFALEGFALNRFEYELYLQAGELVESGEEPGWGHN